MKRMNYAVRMLLMFSIAVSATLVQAQYRASIQGTVTDPQGAVIPGATVSLINAETNQTVTAVTNSAGVYNFNALPPSSYNIKVEKTGFKQQVLQNVNIIAEQANAVNIELAVGQSSEVMEVNGAQAALIDTETSNLSGTVTAKQIQTLPSFGRDVFQLLQLAPGAFGDGAQSAGGGTSNLPATTVGGTGGVDGPFKIENGGQITAGGARTGENNYQIDGVGTTSVTWGGTSVITPNEDSVKEIKILTDNYDAENGRYRGAQVQVISQNGTNDYHGSFFFKAHRPGLNAYTKYNGYNSNTPNCKATSPHCGNVRDDNRFNDLGGSVGGPIWRNKVFTFFSYERLDNNAQQSVTGGWYETSALRALAASGTNAASFYSFPGVQPNGGTIEDRPCSSLNLQEGVDCRFIPGQGLNIGSPLTATLGNRDPGYDPSNKRYGTGGDGSGGPNNLTNTADIAFYQDTVQPSNSTHVQYNGRVDVNLTSKDLVAFSIYYVPNSSTGINGNGDRLANIFNSTSRNRSGTLLWDHTFSSSLLNEARVNASGWQEKDLASNSNAPFGLPQISFNQTGNDKLQGYGVGSFNGFDQWTYAAKDVLTKVHGAHNMKMGAEFSRLLSVDAPFWADRPGYSFNNIWDFLNDAPVQENAQFDPQTGVPSALRKDLRSNVIGIFFQDNYKLRPNLTVTAGLRWEYFGAISEKNGKLATTVLGSGPGLFSDIRVRTGGHLFNPQKTNFAPQLGFAWSPTDFLGKDLNNRLVVRGGFGIAYNGIVQSNSLDGRFNPPFVDNGQTFSCPNGPGQPGCDLTYIGTFPSDVHSPTGYASNPNAVLTFGSNNLPLTGRTDLTAFPADWPTTYDYHYTLGMEYDLGRQWVASIGYQGSQTRHLTNHYNLYNVGAASGILLNQRVSGVTYYTDDGSAHFNALLAEVKHAFTKSFLIDTQYRWSHTLDTGSNAYAGPNYQWSLPTAFATADYDVRHSFKVFGVWSPTFFHGDRAWIEKVAGGWSLSGILNAHTGFPFSSLYNLSDLDNHLEPVFNFGTDAGGGSNDAGSSTLLPAAYNGGFKPNFRSNTTFDASPFFTKPTVVPGTLFDCLFPNPDPTTCPSGQQGYGPLPSSPGLLRNSFRGPNYFDVDATLSKSFGLPTMRIIGEGGRIEFRANFYNLFNKLNLANIQQDIHVGTDGSHFGQAQNALGSRTIELQARFSF